MDARHPFDFLTNPERFMTFSRWAAPMFGAIAAVLAVIGLALTFAAPEDYQQGDTVRMMFIHVPAAVMSMLIYLFLGGASLLSLVFRHALADAAARACAPLGAVFTALALITGSLWGKPMWGTWWQWDARMTSVLVLFLFYLGYLALRSALEDEQKAARAAAILALVGLINLPIVKFLGRVVEHPAPGIVDPVRRAREPAAGGVSVALGPDDPRLSVGLRVAVAGAHPGAGLAAQSPRPGPSHGGKLKMHFDFDAGKYARLCLAGLRGQRGGLRLDDRRQPAAVAALEARDGAPSGPARRPG